MVHLAATREPSAVYASGVLLLTLAAASLLTGCGSSTVGNFHRAENLSLEADDATLVAAWTAAQRTQSGADLENTYDPDYSYNGQSAHDMSEAFLLPETDATEVRSISYTTLQPPDDNDAHATANHGHVVMVRVNVRGVVSASIIHEFIAEDTGEDGATGDDQVHVHSAQVLPGHEEGESGPPGIVSVAGVFDVIMGINGDDAGSPRIVSQRIHTGQLMFGGGLAATTIGDVHAHPDDVHPGHTLEVHGSYASLPPGGAVMVHVGDGDLVPARTASGAFHAMVAAPEAEGRFLATARAFAGDLFTRTASLTTAEREVHVHDG